MSQFSQLAIKIHEYLSNYLPIRDRISLSRTSSDLRDIYNRLSWRQCCSVVKYPQIIKERLNTVELSYPFRVVTFKLLALPHPWFKPEYIEVLYISYARFEYNSDKSWEGIASLNGKLFRILQQKRELYPNLKKIMLLGKLGDRVIGNDVAITSKSALNALEFLPLQDPRMDDLWLQVSKRDVDNLGAFSKCFPNNKHVKVITMDRYLTLSNFGRYPGVTHLKFVYPPKSHIVAKIPSACPHLEVIETKLAVDFFFGDTYFCESMLAFQKLPLRIRLAFEIGADPILHCPTLLSRNIKFTHRVSIIEGEVGAAFNVLIPEILFSQITFTNLNFMNIVYSRFTFFYLPEYKARFESLKGLSYTSHLETENCDYEHFSNLIQRAPNLEYLNITFHNEKNLLERNRSDYEIIWSTFSLLSEMSKRIMMDEEKLTEEKLLQVIKKEFEKHLSEKFPLEFAVRMFNLIAFRKEKPTSRLEEFDDFGDKPTIKTYVWKAMVMEFIMNEVAKLTNLKHLKITGMGSVSFSPGVYTLIKESRALKQILTNSLGANIFWKFEKNKHTARYTDKQRQFLTKDSVCCLVSKYVYSCHDTISKVTSQNSYLFDVESIRGELAGDLNNMKMNVVQFHDEKEYAIDNSVVRFKGWM